MGFSLKDLGPSALLGPMGFNSLIPGIGGMGGKGSSGMQTTGQQTNLLPFQLPIFERAVKAGETAFNKPGLGFDTASGSFLNANNPLLKQQIKVATDPLVEQFKNATIPQLQSSFAKAGRFASGAEFNQRQAENEALARQVGAVSTNLTAENFARERALQEAARSRLDPLSRAQNFANIASMSPGTTVQQPVSKPSGLESLLGTVGQVGQVALPFAAMMSDERLKENIKKIGKLKNGINIYSYNFKGKKIKEIGVLAQEVEKIIPEAVITGIDGFKRVFYGKLGV